MNRTTRTFGVIAAAAALSLAACSSSGGKKATDSAAGAAGKANTPRMTIAMITHAQAGDTFWDIIRKGASMAASKDNVDLQYSADDDPAKQAQLIQAAIDKKVDGIAVTDPNTGALGATIKKAVASGIPVTMFNAGEKDAIGLGALGYFGQDETQAGEAAGAKLKAAGAKHVLCVIQDQGQSQLEARCDGVTKGLGTKVERLYVNGADNSDVTTKINAALTQNSAIDWVMTLGAPFALDAVKALPNGSTAKIATFDTNADLVNAIKSGKVQWAVDQQPYLQGYLAVDSLWLYKTNGNTIGGGAPTATGPAFIDQSNIAKVAEFAANGTR
ncbi:Periplasmic binding protein/LacI transcriptional regulator [Nostocoides japonicum T1-X7]|uniref:Periplasmic binding protein/LacI transcriptional regulator n=1 Tax=Nostocoides japonicum T1-X7 TaxID=1194083 RepID=A0A077M488_9MICO|nr:substrate-binding domain-containing protein [Tetrasphaera japonica]CCH78945.1 Periplasmic binding protein/LacI transcriptional regulator [Tetrasphaera japonica T1-X7]